MNPEVAEERVGDPDGRRSPPPPSPSSSPLVLALLGKINVDPREVRGHAYTTVDTHTPQIHRETKNVSISIMHSQSKKPKTIKLAVPTTRAH
jgi:hypothetical protein